MGSWSKPLPLIENIDDRLRINKHTQDLLQAVDKPLVVVCIAGLYRTGKSYLMNRLAGKQIGFALGSTVESETKGIWIWKVDHPHDPSKALLLMDTEGLGDATKGDANYDMWICCLAVLLSSVFVYNIQGRIERGNIDQLAFVAEMAQHIRTSTVEKSDVDFDQFFPMFILAVRDFFLVPKLNKQVVSADEYMEQTMLKVTNGNNRLSQREKNHNKIKHKIREYFRKRKCFFFSRPTASDTDLCNMENVPDANLKEEFIKASNQFCDFIIKEAPLKKVDESQPANGRILGQLTEMYVNAINNGKLPTIESAISLIKKKENERVLEESIQFYSSNMKEKLQKLPLSTDQLRKIHSECQKKTVSFFLDKIFLDQTQEYHEKLQTSINKKFEEINNENNDASMEACRELLKKLSRGMDQNIRNKKYATSGGFKMYEEDMDKVQSEYYKTPGKGDQDEKIWHEFLIQKQSENEAIYRADLSLTEQDKAIADSKVQKEAAEVKAREAMKELETQRLLVQTLMETHNNQIRETQEIYNKRIEEQQLAFEQRLKEKELEQKRLLEEEYNEQAQRLQNIIEEKRRQNKKSFVRGIIGSVMNLAGTAMWFLPHPAFKVAGTALNITSQFI